MRKRVLSFFLCLAMVLSILPAGAIPAFALEVAAIEGISVTMQDGDGGEQKAITEGESSEVAIEWEWNKEKQLAVTGDLSSVTGAKIRVTVAPGISISTVNAPSNQFQNTKTTYDVPGEEGPAKELTGYPREKLKSGKVETEVLNSASNIYLRVDLSVDTALWPKVETTYQNAIKVEILNSDDAVQKTYTAPVKIISSKTMQNPDSYRFYSSDVNTSVPYNGGFKLKSYSVWPAGEVATGGAYLRKLTITMPLPYYTKKVSDEKVYAEIVADRCVVNVNGQAVSPVADETAHTATWTWNNFWNSASTGGFTITPYFQWPSGNEPTADTIKDKTVTLEKAISATATDFKGDEHAFTCSGVAGTTSFSLVEGVEITLSGVNPTKYISGAPLYELGQFLIRNVGFENSGKTELEFTYTNTDKVQVTRQHIPLDSQGKIAKIEYTSDQKTDWTELRTDVSGNPGSYGIADLSYTKDGSQYFTALKATLDNGFDGGYVGYASSSSLSPNNNAVTFGKFGISPGNVAVQYGSLSIKSSSDEGKGWSEGTCNVSVTPSSTEVAAVLDVRGVIPLGQRTLSAESEPTFTLSGTINAHNYPYTSNQWVKSPVIYIRLPEHVELVEDKITLNNGAALTKDTDFTVSKVAAVQREISNPGGDGYHVYKIASNDSKGSFGRWTETAGAKTLNYSFTMKVGAETAQISSLSTRDILFVAHSETIRKTGSVDTRWATKDVHDVDGDGNVDEQFYTIVSGSEQTLTINAGRFGMVFNSCAKLGSQDDSEYTNFKNPTIGGENFEASPEKIIYLTESAEDTDKASILDFKFTAKNNTGKAITVAKYDGGSEPFRYYIPVPKIGDKWDDHIQDAEFGLDLTLEPGADGAAPVSITGAGSDLFEVRYSATVDSKATGDAENPSEASTYHYTKYDQYKTYDELLETYIKNHAADTGYDAENAETSLAAAKQKPEVIAAALNEVKMIRISLKNDDSTKSNGATIPDNADVTFLIHYRFKANIGELAGASIEFGPCGISSYKINGVEPGGHAPTQRIRVELRTGRIAGIAFIDENWNGTYDEGADTLISFEAAKKEKTEKLPDVIEDVTSNFSATLKNKINSAQTQLGLNLSGVTTTLEQNVNGWLADNSLTRDKVNDSFLYKRLSNVDAAAKPTKNEKLTALTDAVANALNTKLNEEINDLPGETYSYSKQLMNQTYHLTLNMGTIDLNVQNIVKEAIKTAEPGALSTALGNAVTQLESKIDGLTADGKMKEAWDAAVDGCAEIQIQMKNMAKNMLNQSLDEIKTKAKEKLGKVKDLNTKLKEYENSDTNAIKAMVALLEAKVIQTQGGSSVDVTGKQEALIEAIATYLTDLVDERVSLPGSDEANLRAFLDKNKDGVFDAGTDEYLTEGSKWARALTITAKDKDETNGTGTHNAQKPTISDLNVQNPFNNSYALSGLRGSSTEGSETRNAWYTVTIQNPGITTTPESPIIQEKDKPEKNDGYKEYEQYLRFEPLEAGKRNKVVIEEDGNQRTVQSPENAWKGAFNKEPDMTTATYDIEVKGDMDSVVQNRMRDIAFQRPHKVTFAVRYTGEEESILAPVQKYTYYVWHGDTIPTPDKLITLPAGYHWAGGEDTPVWATSGGEQLEEGAKMESTEAEVTYTAIIAQTSYDLIYNANGGTFASNSDETRKEGVPHIQGETVDLGGEEPTHAADEKGKILFVGWTAEKSTRIASRGETLRSLNLIQTVTFGTDDVTVYALWGYDEDSNGIADVREQTFTLTYDANGGAGEPAKKENVLVGEVVTLDSGKPTHDQSTSWDVVFIGWIQGEDSGDTVHSFTKKPDAANKIWNRNDTEAFAGLKLYYPGDGYAMRPGNVTLYAVWGFDADSSGTADLLEKGYTLTLDGNISGQVDGLSGFPKFNMLEGDSLNLPEKPTTSTEVDGKPVVFLGWSKTESGVLYKNSTKPEFFTDVKMPKEDLTLYAIWGKDTDEDGKADVDETKLTLTYDANNGAGGPTDNEKYITGETVTLLTDPKPTHEKEGEKQILFVGWSAQADNTIYTDKTNDGNGPNDLITQVEFKNDQNITVHAVWAYDKNNNNVPDYQEGYSHVTYRNVPVSSEIQPNDQAAYLTGTNAKLWQPAEPPWKATIDSKGVVFLGWSKTEQNSATIVDTADKATEAGIVTEIEIKSTRADEHANDVYAVWAVDENTNGKPDYAETKITVKYNANGGTWKAPGGDGTDPTTVTQAVLPGLSCELPEGQGLTKANGNGYPHVFAGWSVKPTNDAIPAAMNKGVAEQLLASPYTVGDAERDDNPATVTLYAVYAEDINGNDVADYLEFEYTLSYDAGDGTTNAKPHEKVKVAEVVTLSEDVPTHADVGGRKVVFIGWIVGDDEAEEGLQLTGKPEAANTIYNRNANLNDLRLYQPGENYSMRAGNTKLYAVWGYDDNEKNGADATESKYTLALGSNISGAVNGMPSTNPNPNMLEGEALNLPKGTGTDIESINTKPALTIRDSGTVNGNDVVFVGWSETVYPVIPQDYEEDITLYAGTVMPTEHLTLYAVWAVDNNGNGIPDYLEAKSQDSYTIVYDINGGDYNAAHGLGTQAPDLSNVTGQIPGVWIRLSDAQGYEKTMTKEEAGIELTHPAVFAGWSLSKQAGCIPFNVTDERLAAFGLVSDPFTITDEIIEKYAKDKVITLYAVYAEDQTGEGRPTFEVERRYMEYYANGGEARDGYQIADDGLIMNCGMGNWAHSHISGSEVTLPEAHLTLKLFNRMLHREDATIIGWKEHKPYEKIVTSQAEADDQVDDKVTVSEDITRLYAVWAIDLNHNGKADYLEEQFEHKYYDNSNLYGTMTEGHTGVVTGKLPDAQQVLLGTSIAFDANLGLKLTETDADNTIYHRYVQVGWSANPCRLAESAEDAEAWSIRVTGGKRLISDVTELAAYAIWAVDDNNDGIPDYSQDAYTVSYDLNEGTAAADEDYTEQEVLPGNTVTVKKAPTRTGYTFTGWQVNDESNTVYQPGETLTVDRSLTLTAQWRQNGGGGGGAGGGSVTDKYTVKYDLNGADTAKDKYKDESVSSGTEVTVKEAPSREDFKFAGWKGSDGKMYQAGDKLKVTGNITLTAQWVSDPNATGVSDLLNAKDHMDYLHGYGNGLFGPNNNMTRAEAAQMFYNLLKDKNVKITASFTDVPKDAWYAQAVNALASLGILKGVGDNKFAPAKEITRAEFVAIIARFAKMDSDSRNVFNDVNANDWFYSYVLCSIKYGWINGYPDGGFHPYDKITRAETAAVMNRILGRKADVEYVDSHVNKLAAFTDVASGHWAYYDIREATNAHDYSVGGGAEEWTVLK